MEEHHHHRSFTVPALILGASLIITSIIAASSFYKVKALADLISVTGSAQKLITSDVAKWRISITRTTELTDLTTGYASMKSDLAILKKYLMQNQIEDAWVTVAPITVTTNFNYNAGGAVSGYSLSQEVIVESTNVDTVAKAAEEAGSLLSQGALVSTSALEYYYSKLADVKIEMLSEATKDAQKRAQNIAESAGSKIGSLRAASMGVIQVSAKNSADVSDSGYFDTASKDKQITAVVRASFGLR